MDILRRAEAIPNNGPKVETVSIVFVCLSILFVGARYFRRLVMSGSSVGADDLLILVALVRHMVHYPSLI